MGPTEIAEDERRDLVCVVVTPAGSRNNYLYNPSLGEIMFQRRLNSSETPPVDTGFLRDTLTANGQPLRALVCVHKPTFPGCLVPVKPVGLVKTIAGGDVVVCVPTGDPNWNEKRDIEDLPIPLRADIELLYRDSPRFAEWGTRAEANRAVASARERAKATGAKS